jgi:hypothetical protein
MLSKYLKSKTNHIVLLLLSLSSLLISFITNSILFFIIPVGLIVLVFHYNSESERKIFLYTSIGICISIVIFVIYKSLFLQPDINSVDRYYNTITIKGLFFRGPIMTIYALLGNVYGLSKYFIVTFLDLGNLGFLIMTAVLLWLIFRKSVRFNYTWKSVMILLSVGLILSLSAIYPYAVVGKMCFDPLSYGHRFNLLLPIGFSIIIISMIYLLFKKSNIRVLVLSILMSIFLVGKINVTAQYYDDYKLQEAFINEYRQNYYDDRSVLYIIKKDVRFDMHLWRFYEFGGMLKSKGLPENKIFLYENNDLFLNENGNIKDLNILHSNYINGNFNIREFDINNYSIVHMKLDIKPSINIIEFLYSIIADIEYKEKIKIIIEN